MVKPRKLRNPFGEEPKPKPSGILDRLYNYLGNDKKDDDDDPDDPDFSGQCQSANENLYPLSQNLPLFNHVCPEVDLSLYVDR